MKDDWSVRKKVKDNNDDEHGDKLCMRNYNIMSNPCTQHNAKNLKRLKYLYMYTDKHTNFIIYMLRYVYIQLFWRSEYIIHDFDNDDTFSSIK